MSKSKPARKCGLFLWRGAVSPACDADRRILRGSLSDSYQRQAGRFRATFSVGWRGSTKSALHVRTVSPDQDADAGAFRPSASTYALRPSTLGSLSSRPLGAPAAFTPRSRDNSSRTRAERRWGLVALSRPHTPRKDRRIDYEGPRLNPPPSTSVTHHPGINCHPSSPRSRGECTDIQQRDDSRTEERRG